MFECSNENQVCVELNNQGIYGRCPGDWWGCRAGAQAPPWPAKPCHSSTGCRHPIDCLPAIFIIAQKICAGSNRTLGTELILPHPLPGP